MDHLTSPTTSLPRYNDITQPFSCANPSRSTGGEFAKPHHHRSPPTPSPRAPTATRPWQGLVLLATGAGSPLPSTFPAWKSQHLVFLGSLPEGNSGMDGASLRLGTALAHGGSVLPAEHRQGYLVLLALLLGGGTLPAGFQPLLHPSVLPCLTEQAALRASSGCDRTVSSWCESRRSDACTPMKVSRVLKGTKSSPGVAELPSLLLAAPFHFPGQCPGRGMMPHCPGVPFRPLREPTPPPMVRMPRMGHTCSWCS